MANLKKIASGTMIGFTANKTVAAAKNDTATNRVDICMTKELYLNGERLGITDAESTYLAKKITEENNARLQVEVITYVNDTATSAPYVDKQDGTRVKVVVAAKWDGFYVAADSITLTNSAGTAQTLVADLSQIGAKATTATLKADERYMATVTHNGVKKVVYSAQIKAYYPVYYGVNSAETISAVTGLTKKTATASAAGTYAFTFANGQYAYILIPTGVGKGKFATADKEGVYHASEGVSDVPFIKQAAAITLNNASYEAYRLASPQDVSSHDITI